MPKQGAGGPAVLLECRTALDYLGYGRIPDEKKKQWLGERFFRPSSVPGTYDLAAVSNVRRLRAACWRAVYPVEAVRLEEKHRDRKLRRGRPPLWRTRGVVLRKIVHEPGNVLPARWQWPLITLAMDEELPLEESLWILTRATVLPPPLARGAAVGVLDAAVALLGGILPEFGARVKALAQHGERMAGYRDGLLAHVRANMVAPPGATMGLFAAAGETMGSDVYVSLAHTVGYVGVACAACGYSMDVIRKQCYAGIRGVILFGETGEV